MMKKIYLFILIFFGLSYYPEMYALKKMKQKGFGNKKAVASVTQAVSIVQSSQGVQGTLEPQVKAPLIAQSAGSLARAQAAFNEVSMQFKAEKKERCDVPFKSCNDAWVAYNKGKEDLVAAKKTNNIATISTAKKTLQTLRAAYEKTSLLNNATIEEFKRSIIYQKYYAAQKTLKDLRGVSSVSL